MEKPQEESTEAQLDNALPDKSPEIPPQKPVPRFESNGAIRTGREHMKQPSQYRKLKLLEVRLGIVRHILGMVWLVWPWK
jgi:hypothetical protein